MTTIAIDLIRINRMMQRFGPEADEVRAKLRTSATAKMQELFPAPGKPSQSTEATVRMMGETSHDNRWGGSSEHEAGQGTEHTNAYGGSTAHAYGGGTEHTNV